MPARWSPVCQDRLGRSLSILFAGALACVLVLPVLTGCVGGGAGDTDEAVSEQAAGEDEATPYIQARVGTGDASNAIVVDGTVELVNIQTVDPSETGEVAPDAEAAGEATGTTCYALRLDRSTTFSMLYTAAGLHESDTTTDVVLLYTGSHYDAIAAQGTDAGDLFWKDLVGTQLSVRGDLWVSGANGIVGLEYPLAADAGRLAQQIGVAPNLLGMAGAEDYDRKGYSWTQLSTIARAMSATQNRTYGFRIANAYRLLSGDNDVKTLKIGDRSCQMRLVDVMADVATTGSDEARYLGMTFVSADTPLEHAFDVRDYGVTHLCWADSDLADWLDTEVYEQLPKKLRKLITPASKACTAVDEPPAAPSLTWSTHRLWVPSVVEMGGAPEWGYYNTWLDADQRTASNETLAQEESKSQGSTYDKKYLYYYRHSVNSNDESNEALSLVDEQTGEGYSWWTRTIDPSGYPHYVYTNGSMQYASVPPETPLRIVFGFCLG